MTQAVPRTHFHRSTLMRCLAELGADESIDTGKAFAEQLSQWIHFADAISLSAVLSDGAAQPARPPPARTAERAAACETASAAFHRVHSLLSQSITAICSPTPGKTHIRPPELVLALPLDLPANWAGYRRFHEAHQRDMELHLQPLRSTLREALANASPQLGKLAALDAVLEKILRERESKLLARVPQLLRKRFEQLCQEHQQHLLAAQREDNPAGWLRPGGWLARFNQDLRTLLLAELELRLQPAQGLMEVLNNESP